MRKVYKILVLALSLYLAVLNPVNISLVYAQTDTPTGTPTDTPTATPTYSASPVPTDTGSPSPTDTPTASPTDIPTDTPTPTDIASPSPTDTPIDTSSPSADIASPTPDATDSATPTDTPTATPSDPSIDQSANTTSDTTSSANTGNNSQQGSGSATTLTGDAGSTSNSITVANLSEVDSNLVTTIQNILTSNTGDVDLYQALLSAIANNPNLVPLNTDITATQSADVNTNTASSANTGDNSQEASGSATMTTGEAIALANAITAANINLVGANAVFAIINILADWNGNIILPNGSQLSLPSGPSGNVNVTANQNADVSSTTASSANTGGNSQTGQNTALTTGNSVSAANSGTIANVIEIGNGLGFLIINYSGNWTGSLINWTSPGSSQTFDPGAYNLSTEYGTPSASGGEGTTNVTSNQEATVTTNVSSNANTGGNSQTGKNLNLLTGNAISLANNFTLANLTGVGGGFFFGIINILGNWGGNIITAYPELNVTVNDNQDNVYPGGAENYSVTVTNLGHAIADGVNLNFAFPGEVTPDSPENTSWNLGNLNPGQSQTFNLNGHVSSSTPAGTNLLASATGTTNNTQDSTSGDTGTDTTDVVLPPDPGPDTRTPDLHVSTWNNVGAYVYPGDTVLASVTVYNQSSYVAHNVEVQGSVFDDNKSTQIPLDWKLGDLKINGKAKISFNITLKKDGVPGIYHLTAQAQGQSESGDIAGSNIAESSFLVEAKTATSAYIAPPIVGNTAAPSGGAPGVLGLSTQTAPFNMGSLSPYLFPSLTFAYLLIVLARRRLQGLPLVSPALTEFLKKRKTAFAGGLLVLIATAVIFWKKFLG